ncbi:hypothetical protein [Infirmifilum uzonense]|uniref:hypothetical protein n=1 Tax=Infirmifilum TaxID=2856573 RepID=UPI003C771B90
MSSDKILENISPEMLSAFSKKLGTSEGEVKEKLKDLAQKRLFVYFSDTPPPQIEGVKVLRKFKDLNILSVECTLEGLISLLKSDNVIKVEPVPKAKALGKTIREA